MTTLIIVSEADVESSITTSSPVIGWRAHYAGGEIFTSQRHSWDDLPATGLILLSLIEQNQFIAGRHFRSAIQAEWYGFDGSAFYSINAPDFTLTEVQLRWPLVSTWKQGVSVTDAEMNAAFDADSSEWAI